MMASSQVDWGWERISFRQIAQIYKHIIFIIIGNHWTMYACWYDRKFFVSDTENGREVHKKIPSMDS